MTLLFLSYQIGFTGKVFRDKLISKLTQKKTTFFRKFKKSLVPYDTNSITYVIRESCYSLNGLFTSASLKRCCFHDNRMYNNKKREKSLTRNSWPVCVCVCWEGEVDICSFLRHLYQSFLSDSRLTISQAKTLFLHECFTSAQIPLIY